MIDYPALTAMKPILDREEQVDVAISTLVPDSGELESKYSAPPPGSRSKKKCQHRKTKPTELFRLMNPSLEKERFFAFTLSKSRGWDVQCNENVGAEKDSQSKYVEG